MRATKGSLIIGQNHFLFHVLTQSLRSPVLVGAGAGCKKGWWRPSDTQTTNILPGLAVRSSRYLPRKAAMVRMTSQGERFGTEGSIPSLGTTAVMRTTAQRQNSSSEGRSRTSHKAGNRINGGSNPPPATKRSDALHEVIIGLG